jgi:ATP-dependent RNA helicase DDX41
MQTAEQTLLDLKYLLMEAKQKWVFAISRFNELIELIFLLLFTFCLRIPPFLATIEDLNAGSGGVLGCTNCGGLGHSITNCPKLEENQRRTVAGHQGGEDRGGGY